MSQNPIPLPFAQDAYLTAPDHIEGLAETQFCNHIHCHQRPPLEDIDTARTLRFLNHATHSEADKVRRDWFKRTQRAFREIGAKETASFRVKIWIACRENALEAASSGIETGFDEWISHTMNLANGVAIGYVDIPWTQPDDGSYPMKRLLASRSTGAEILAHRIFDAENGHTGRACHAGFLDERANQSISRLPDLESPRVVLQMLYRSSASTISFSPCFDSKETTTLGRAAHQQ
ncbi:MAG: hypothetical protein Q9181_006211 [Wetmoreana brouardii]